MNETDIHHLLSSFRKMPRTVRFKEHAANVDRPAPDPNWTPQQVLADHNARLDEEKSGFRKVRYIKQICAVDSTVVALSSDGLAYYFDWNVRFPGRWKLLPELPQSNIN